ncbi:MAG: hypothetical protein ACOX3G_08490 [Armatimonadota bacterium]
MDCIDRKELKQFLEGKLAAQRLIEIDEHLDECKACRAAAGRMSPVINFASEVMGTTDCPEYEELSAYVDQSLETERMKSVRSHIGLCEICSRDVDRIRELRSHAALREKIVVRPQKRMSRRRRGAFVYWRQALAAVSLGGVIAVAIVFGNAGDQNHNNRPQVANNPPIVSNLPKAPADDVAKTQAQEAPAVVESAPPSPSVVAEAPAKPAPVVKTVLRDGRYSVVSSDGKIVFAKKDGAVVRGGAGIAAAIDEKLRTGKIKPAKPIQVAMATIHVRSAGTYDVSPTAPRLIAPVEKVLITQKPAFTWAAVDLAESYRVRVYDKSGNLIIDQVVQQTTFTPSSSLPRGKAYSWRVGVRFSETDGWVESAAGGFAVISAEDYSLINRTRRDFAGSHLAMGAAYESAGLYEEAAAEYKALRRANPNSELANRLLDGVAGN